MAAVMTSKASATIRRKYIDRNGHQEVICSVQSRARLSLLLPRKAAHSARYKNTTRGKRARVCRAPISDCPPCSGNSAGLELPVPAACQDYRNHGKRTLSRLLPTEEGFAQGLHTRPHFLLYTRPHKPLTDVTKLAWVSADTSSAYLNKDSAVISHIHNTGLGNQRAPGNQR